MAAQVQIVGDVPVAVLREVESLGFGVARAKLADTPDVGAAHAIVHVPQDPGLQAMAELEGWLAAAEDEDARVGITSSQGMTTDVSYLMFKPAVHVLRLLNHGDEAFPDAVARLLAADAYLERPKEDDVRVGSHFDRAPDSGVYGLQRQLSLSSATMEPFLQKLRDAVLAMQAPLPDAVLRALNGQVPWDPFGEATDRQKLPPTPSLADVFRLHATPQARKLMQPPGAEGWTAPKLLIMGESGVGKSLVARLVSELVGRSALQDGPRGEHPFVTVNCAGLTDSVSHQLFGAAPGVYTDIPRGVVGELAKAAHGTAFLDEIGDMELATQRSLLVYLQDGMVRPFGIERFQGFTRIIGATNRNVPLLIERRQFRHDLAARFDFQIEIPTLRSREESELERLVDFAALNPVHNPEGSHGELSVTHISRNALTALSRREYRIGNFRELETTVHTAMAKARLRRSRCIRTKDLPDEAQDLTVLDSDANVIEIRNAPEGRTIDVAGESDLIRAAHMLNAPVLRDGAGTRYVMAPHHVLRLGSEFDVS